MEPDIITYGAAGLAFIAITAVGFAFAGGGRGKQTKRLKAISEGAVRTRGPDNNALRRKQMADTTKMLREREEANRKNKAFKATIEDKIKQAGFEFPESTFWIASAITGAVACGGAFFATGFSTEPLQLLICAGVAFAAAFGLPRWVLGMAIKGRQKKFVEQFADALDVIVRGVKSGLPLNECLAIIARESPSPVREEFKELVEQQRVGVPLSECFARMMGRMPLPEVNFFAIVISIQQQAGGNLSEALGNLAGVLRDRKRLQSKVKALSAEAKASAGVLAALPFMVMLMVYLSTPKYIGILFTTKMGQFLLLCAAGWMTCGVLVMRKMINFKY